MLQPTPARSREQELRDRIEELETLLGLREKLVVSARFPKGTGQIGRKILSLLASVTPRTLPRDFIVRAVWGEKEINDRTVDANIARLRRLGYAIMTVAYEGYYISREEAMRILERKDG